MNSGSPFIKLLADLKSVDASGAVFNEVINSLEQSLDEALEDAGNECDALICLLTSFDDRVHNHFGRKEKAKSIEFVRRFHETTTKSLFQLLERFHGQKVEYKLLWRLILSESKHNGEVLDRLLALFTTRDVLVPLWSRLFQHVFTDLKSHEWFLTLILDRTEKPSHLVRLFGSAAILQDGKLRDFLTEVLLVRRIQSANSVRRHSYLLAGYFAHSDPKTLIECFARVCECFHRHSENDFSDFEQQLQTAVATVDLAKAIPADLKSKAREFVTKHIPPALPNYLHLGDTSKRQLGMIVGETLIKLFPLDCEDQLTFEYDEKDPLFADVLKAIEEPLEDGFLHDCLKRADSCKASVSNVQHEKTILDSDDDEDGEDVGFMAELNDYASRPSRKTSRIPQLIDKLTEKEDVKRFYSGFHDLIEYLPSDEISPTDISPELVNRVVNLENRFDLPQFSEMRQQVLELCFARRPELVSHVVRLMLSQSCEMTDRYFILQSLIGAAHYISSGIGLSEATKRVEAEMAAEKKTAFEKFEKVTLDDQPRTGKLTRASESLVQQKKEQEAEGDPKNPYLQFVPQFVYPLVQEEVEGLHLDFKKKDDAVFLSRILLTAGILLGFGRLAPSIVSMSRALLQFVEKAKGVESEEVVESIVFCYGAIAQAVKPTVFFDVFGDEVCDWIEYLVALKESRVCDSVPSLRQVLESTVGLLVHTVNSAQGELGVDWE